MDNSPHPVPPTKYCCCSSCWSPFWSFCGQGVKSDSVEAFSNFILAAGHLLPLFARTEENAARYMSRTPRQCLALIEEKKQAVRRHIYFHLQFHPDDPSSSAIQRLWRDNIFSPMGEDSRPLNLRNKFSVHNIHGRGKPLSEYLAG